MKEETNGEDEAMVQKQTRREHTRGESKAEKDVQRRRKDEEAHKRRK